MSRNLRLATAFAVAAGSRFGFGVWLLYYLRLTDYRGVGLTEVVYILVAFLAEIPTGAVADGVGRRRTLVLHGGVTAIAYVVLARASGLTELAVASGLLALGRAFYSGTFEALVYESLQQDGQSGRYAHVIGRLNAWRRGSLAISSVLGGYLYTVSPSLPYAAAAGSFAFAALVAAGLREPRRVGAASPGRPSLAAQVRGGWVALTPLLTVALIAFVLLAGTMLVVTDEVLDDALAVQLGFSARQLGWLYALIYLISAAASHRSADLERRYGRIHLFVALAVLAGGSLMLSPWAGMVLGGALVVLRYAVRAVWENARSDLLNQRLDSDNRATALSTFAMLERLPYVLAALAVGAAIDTYGAAGLALPLGAALTAVAIAGAAALLRRS